MADKIIINKKTYELPKRTLELADKIDALLEIEESYIRAEIKTRDIITAEFNFLLELMGDKNVTEMLGTSDLESCDVGDISCIVASILSAYNSRVEQEKLKNKLAVLNNPDIKKAMDFIDKASKADLISSARNT